MSGLICELCNKVIWGEFIENKVKLKKTHQNDYLAKFTSYMCVNCAIKADVLGIPEDWNRYFKPGDQIVYIPDHAKGKLNHPAVMFGFVCSVDP